MTRPSPTKASALPLGSIAPRVTFEDTRKKPFSLPNGRITLVFYEDKDAGSQNEHTRRVVGEFDNPPANRERLSVVAIGDLEKWNWFPAHDYAIKEMSKIEAKENLTLFCDWTGEVRRAWRLTPGKSGILLLDGAGVVRFLAEGPLSRVQLDDLTVQFKALGIEK